MARGRSRGASEDGAGVPAARSVAYPPSVDRLIAEFARLPGIGRRSAERLAFHVLRAPADEALALSRAIADVKQKIGHCATCWNLTDRGEGASLCAICADPRRDRATVLVVEQPKDLIALEQTTMFRGLYHVLMGRLSPLDGVGPGDLTVRDLAARVEDPARNPGGVRVEEVVLGLNPTVEGDGTGLYIAESLRGSNVRVSRLARGLPTGSSLEFANRAVLADAILCRQRVE